MGYNTTAIREKVSSKESIDGNFCNTEEVTRVTRSSMVLLSQSSDLSSYKIYNSDGHLHQWKRPHLHGDEDSDLIAMNMQTLRVEESVLDDFHISISQILISRKIIDEI